MSNGLIQTFTGPWLQAPATLSDNQYVVAIADPHGMAEHLNALMRAVDQNFFEHQHAHADAQCTLVYLGDYIDRGPESLGVIDSVMRGVDALRVDQVSLLGNHDRWLQMLLEGELDEESAGIWMMNGGLDTLASFGFEASHLPHDVSVLGGEVAYRLGWKRVHWLRYLKRTHRIGPYLFVHAGLDPHRDLDNQTDEEYLWIRQAFLEPDAWPWPETICVHGHTPGATGRQSHRIGVDTGCFSSGILTAVELNGGIMRYVCAIGPSRNGKIKRRYLPEGLDQVVAQV